MTDDINRASWEVALKEALDAAREEFFPNKADNPNAFTRREYQEMYGCGASKAKDELAKLMKLGRVKQVFKIVNGQPSRAYLLVDPPPVQPKKKR
jgi:hypothetical protein